MFISRATLSTIFHMSHSATYSSSVFSSRATLSFYNSVRHCYISFRPKGYVGKKRLAAEYTGTTDIFRGMEVKSNFHKGIEVKKSIGRIVSRQANKASLIDCNCSVLQCERYDNIVLIQSLPCADYPRSRGLKCEWKRGDGCFDD